MPDVKKKLEKKAGLGKMEDCPKHGANLIGRRTPNQKAFTAESAEKKQI